ncbi:MAG: ribonuclease D [Alphaproteobacteria bacterium]
MTLITQQDALAELCRDLARAEFVTVDTEFMRESTYWPQLCLVQLAGPDRHAAIDPLAPGLDLQPLYDLMADTSVLKVFHAARQDIEIFLHQGKVMPRPVFDTQIAAMVCGYGESVGYETLVVSLAGKRIDKVSRFTNWANRPLSPQQLEYALADVTHLRVVYQKLRERLDREGRTAWVEEEDATLVADGTYDLDPQNAWRRLRPRTDNPRFLAVLQAVAAWREREAQQRNSPRNWVLRDDTLMDIAAQAPKTPEALARSRGLPKGFADGRHGRGLLEAVAAGLAVPAEQRPRLAARADMPSSLAPVVELLKVLLKLSCDRHGVAAKLVASTADLEAIAMDDAADVPALHGWRREVFGEAALALKHGRAALAIRGRELTVVPVDATTATTA